MKWLPASRLAASLYFDDASSSNNKTIWNYHPQPFTNYSISRVNPIFVEEKEETQQQQQQQAKQKQQQQLIEDNNIYEEKYKTDNTAVNVKSREEALEFLRQNSDFVRSIPIPDRSLKRISNKQQDNQKILSPIPEGKVDTNFYCWKNNNETDSSSSGYDDVPFGKLFPKRKKDTCKYYVSKKEDGKIISKDECSSSNKSMGEILTELSNTIQYAITNLEHVGISSQECIINSLREKINDFFDKLPNETENTTTDATVATLSRAFSFINSFKGVGFPPADDDENGRLLLLKRLGKLNSLDGGGSSSSYEPINHHFRSSNSSSSAASTSGFSDLTHTPTSSTSPSETPPASRNNENVQDDCSYKTNHNNIINKQINHNIDYERSIILRPNSHQLRSQAFISSAIPQISIVPLHQPSLQISTTNFKPLTKTDNLLSSYPGHRCPDFTLDVQQAEKLMKKIKMRKKERCWCRLTVSFIAVIFLLFAVIFFSMIVTGGEKMFGSI